MGGLPELPGILAVMQLAPALALHLRGLADVLLVKDFPGATLSRSDRELLATAVSAANDCFYCMDSHGSFAAELLLRATGARQDPVIDAMKTGGVEGLSARLAALVSLARTVQRRALDLTSADVAQAKAAGASDGDIQLAILIAAGFSMYNRMVDGLRTTTPPSAEAFGDRARQIADHGYSSPGVSAVPR
ncbi:MAG TPA: carboxymuconolactone decarboxylase family protein [Polyangiaceae bacterium]|nr:carboxymuconolactone decarboxylase family protein [Polyangiaceae bacterium]